jgi:hypothetical protein
MAICSRILFGFCATVFGLLGFANAACAHLPPECTFQHAIDDFAESNLVIIGRVTAVERYRLVSNDPAARHVTPFTFTYLATITVGKVIRGESRPGDQVLLCVGFYEQRVANDTDPAVLRVANTHPAWSADYGKVYLLALVRERVFDDCTLAKFKDGEWVASGVDVRTIWRPRSCHWSIHEVRNKRQERTVDVESIPSVHVSSEVYASVYLDRWGRDESAENWVRLEDLIAARERGVAPDTRASLKTMNQNDDVPRQKPEDTSE